MSSFSPRVLLLTAPGHAGPYTVVADCQHACKGLSPTFLYQGLQYPNLSSLCVRSRSLDIGLLALYRGDGILDLPPFGL